jgi:hypothetical protein
METSPAETIASQKPEPTTVQIGDTFRMDCALGTYECRVARRHREAGHYECVQTRWLTEVPEFRNGFNGTIYVMARADILAAMREG